MIRRLLTMAGLHGGRVSVIDYGEGLAIAAAAHPIELVVNLDRDQALELAETLTDWLQQRAIREQCVASVQPLNSRSL